MTTKNSTAKDTNDDAASQIEARERQEQANLLEELKAKLAAAEARANSAEGEAEAAKNEAAEAKDKADQAEAKAQEAARQLVELSEAKSEKTTKAAQPKIVTVISLTQYSYLVDGVRVTPDVPVKLEWRPGNLLDCNMKAGLIGEYEV